MELEDHLGDIVRKAREARSLSLEDGARVSQLPVLQYEQLEQTGTLPPLLSLAGVAAALDLDLAKLQSLAAGWRPARPDLTQWRELRQVTTSQEGLTVHSYLVWDEVTRHAALFDTGWQAEPILALLSENQLQLKHLFITHTHDDHINAMGPLRQHCPGLLLHSNSTKVPPQHRNRPKDFIHLGNLRITNRATPGHTDDGASYIVGNWADDAPHAVFCGDTLFAGSIATGHQSHSLLRESIKTQLFSLPPPTLVCPGHGPLTTIGEEKEHNPFFAN